MYFPKNQQKKCTHFLLFEGGFFFGDFPGDFDGFDSSPFETFSYVSHGRTTFDTTSDKDVSILLKPYTKNKYKHLKFWKILFAVSISFCCYHTFHTFRTFFALFHIIFTFKFEHNFFQNSTKWLWRYNHQPSTTFQCKISRNCELSCYQTPCAQFFRILIVVRSKF